MGPSSTLVNVMKNMPFYDHYQAAFSVMTPFHQDCDKLDDIIRRYAN